MKPFIEHGMKEVNLVSGQYTLHGDVHVDCIDDLPDGFNNWPIVADDCLAYGESTGHAHKLFGEFELRENPESKERVFISKGNVTYLKHQEHKPQAFLGEGKIYRHRIVREYDHFSQLIRQVQD